MATKVAYIYTAYDSEMSFLDVYTATSPSSPLLAMPGDTISFINEHVGGLSGTILLTSFSASYWTVTSNLSFNIKSSGAARVLTGGSYSTDIQIPIYYNRSGQEVSTTLYLRVGNPPDTIPDPFSFPATNNLAKGAGVYSSTITLAGFNTPVTASVSAGSFFRVNGGGNVTSATVNPGNTIQLYTTASPTSSGIKDVTFSAGVTSAKWRVTTANYTPVNPNFGNNITGADASVEYSSLAATISGLTIGVTASVNGGATFTKNGLATRYTSTSVVNGDVLRVYMTSSPTYNAMVSTTIAVGDYSRSWSITTSNTSPQQGAKVRVSTSVPFAFSTAKALWGPISGGNNLSNYVRGGSLVPNITENSTIPTGAGLSLGNLVGKYTSLYFSSPTLPSLSADIDTFYSASNTEILYAIMNFARYGAAADRCEFMYSMQTIDSGMNILAAGMTTWSNANKILKLQVYTPPSMASGQHTGVILCSMRHPSSPSQVVTALLAYDVQIYNSYI